MIWNYIKAKCFVHAVIIIKESYFSLYRDKDMTEEKK